MSAVSRSGAVAAFEIHAEIHEIDIANSEHAVAAALAIYLAEATAYHDDTLDDRADLYDEQVDPVIAESPALSELDALPTPAAGSSSGPTGSTAGPMTCSRCRTR